MLTVLLNVRPAALNLVPPIQPVALVLDEHPDEFDPEVVFQACNRIEDIASDSTRLPEWARPLRRTLEQAQAFSMSPEDWIFVTSKTGQELGGIRCDSFGWSQHPHERRSQRTQGAKLWHCD